MEEIIILEEEIENLADLLRKGIIKLLHPQEE